MAKLVSYDNGLYEPKEWTKVLDSLYILPYPENSKFILFAPFSGKAWITKDVKWNDLSQLGVTEKEKIVELFFKDKIKDQSSCFRESPHMQKYCPTSGIFLMGRRCFCKCIYCYANASITRHGTISLDLAKKTVDFVLKNAKNQNKVPYFAFHGPGEPLIHHRLITDILDYVSKKYEGTVQYHLVTSGIGGHKQLLKIAKRIKEIQVSFDGPPDIHNFQRPLQNGENGHKIALKAIKMMQDAGCNVTIKATITPYSADKIGYIFDYVETELGSLNALYLGIVLSMGRGSVMDQQFPTEIFLAEYYKSKQHAKVDNVYVTNVEKVFPNIVNKYCGIQEPNFCITPEGNVTACYSITEEDDPKSSLFFYGKYNQYSQKFDIDFEKIKNIKHYILGIGGCTQCFALPYCAGDCVTRHSQINSPQDINTASDPRCRVTRTLLYMKLLEHLNDQ